MLEYPLFPLHAVLFPGGSLELRIFEPRYMDMVSRCLKGDSTFAVILIREGLETDPDARCYTVGTLARITDWNTLDGGLLGISCSGTQRFRLQSQRTAADQLRWGEITLLPAADRVEVPVKWLPLVDLLRELVVRVGPGYKMESENYNDATWVSCRLAELLPLDLTQRQLLLEIDDPVDRLEGIVQAIDGFEVA